MHCGLKFHREAVRGSVTHELYSGFPTFSFVYNIIEVICISQKFSQDLIALAATQRTHRCWSVSTRFPPSSPFTKDGLSAPLKLYHGLKQVFFVQRTLRFIDARSMPSAGRLIS